MERLFCDPAAVCGLSGVRDRVRGRAYALKRSVSFGVERRARAAAAARPDRRAEPYRVAIGGVALSLSCHHCDPAPCVDACITGGDAQREWPNSLAIQRSASAAGCA
jgi:Fe-S-cluster-containing dehydrogenase component